MVLQLDGKSHSLLPSGSYGKYVGSKEVTLLNLYLKVGRRYKVLMCMYPELLCMFPLVSKAVEIISGPG